MRHAILLIILFLIIPLAFAGTIDIKVLNKDDSALLVNLFIDGSEIEEKTMQPMEMWETKANVSDTLHVVSIRWVDSGQSFYREAIVPKGQQFVYLETKEYSLIKEGNICSADEQCETGYCVHYICRSIETFCGDGFCDEKEICEKDCSGVDEETEGYVPDDKIMISGRMPGLLADDDDSTFIRGGNQSPEKIAEKTFALDNISGSGEAKIYTKVDCLYGSCAKHDGCGFYYSFFNRHTGNFDEIGLLWTKIGTYEDTFKVFEIGPYIDSSGTIQAKIEFECGMDGKVLELQAKTMNGKKIIITEHTRGDNTYVDKLEENKTKRYVLPEKKTLIDKIIEFLAKLL